jgi:hypothetical protein
LPPSDYVYNASIANETGTCIAVGIKANVRLESHVSSVKPTIPP